jgi:hypothetical protein
MADVPMTVRASLLQVRRGDDRQDMLDQEAMLQLDQHDSSELPTRI